MSPLLQSEHCFLSFLCRNFPLYQANSDMSAWSSLLAARALAAYALHQFTLVKDLGLWSTARMPPPQHSALSGTSPMQFPIPAEMHQAAAAIHTWHTNAALYGHSPTPVGLALSCKPLLLGKMHFLLPQRCLC